MPRGVMSCTPDDTTPRPTGTRCGINILGATISDAQTNARLAAQQDLLAKRYRGNMQQLRTWTENCTAWSGAAPNAAGVAIIVRRSDMYTFCEESAAAPEYHALLSLYGGPTLNLRNDDFLHPEMAWDNPRGTAFLIDEFRMLTAGHILKPDFVDAIAQGKIFVAFDFQTQDDGEPRRMFVLNDNLFRVVGVGPRGSGQGARHDWGTLILEQSPVTAARRPLTLDASDLSMPRAVYTLGHPQALVMRYAYSPVSTASSQEPGCHEAYVDGYCGGSGSPVIDANTHKVVGILIRSCGSGAGADRTQAGSYVSQVCTPQLNTGGSLFIGASAFAQDALATLPEAPAP